MKKLIALAVMLGVTSALAGSFTSPLSWTFGSNNDGDGGFAYYGVKSLTNSAISLTTGTDAVNYRSEAANDGTFVKQIDIWRAPDTGLKYTVSGTMTINDDYADDNNRIDLLLFTDPTKAASRDNSGQIGIVWNTDDSSRNKGPTGDNKQDNLSILNGYNNADADVAVTPVLRNQTIQFAQDILQGGQITLSATFWFTGTDINIDATMTDAGGVTSIGTAVVNAADFTGDYFGFASTARARSYDGTPDPTGAARDNPLDMDYISFSIVPEPATVGMFGFFGAALLLIRRRLAKR